MLEPGMEGGKRLRRLCRGIVERHANRAVTRRLGSQSVSLSLTESQKSQGLAISGQLDGTADVADVFFGVIDS